MAAQLKKISIIIPVYNEQLTIDSILRRINALSLINDIEKEVIVVNDASTDKTEEVFNSTLQSLGINDIVYCTGGLNR